MATKTEPKNEKDFSSQFMLKEYDRLSTLRTEEISQSARRVDFFLTITVAVVGGLFVVIQISTLPKDLIMVTTLGALVILLLFGLHTLNRLNARNAQLRFIGVSIVMVQNYFGRHDPEIAEYLEKLEEERNKPQYRGVLNFILKRLRGTLTDLIVFSNGLISGGISLVIFYSRGYPTQMTVVWSVIVTMLSIVVIYIYHYTVQRKLSPFG